MNTQNPRTLIEEMAHRARAAARRMAALEPGVKSEALLAMASALESRCDSLREANTRDLRAGRKQGLSDAMLDRLELTEKRIGTMAQAIREIAALPDPVGEIVRSWKRPGGLEVGRMRVPLGVIGIIYESRPNVTSDAASLCFKAGNATILRGGSEAFQSNAAIAQALRQVLESRDLPVDAIQLVGTTDREAVGHLLRQDTCIDLIIPRGGKTLIRRVVEESTIPVIKHYEGICHVYVDREANVEMALRITLNAKLQRPAVCNAMETLLVHVDRSQDFLPLVLEELQRAGVVLHGCQRTRSLGRSIEPVTPESFRTEYLAKEMNVRVVDSFEEAVEHIANYGSAHTDAIITENYGTARRFVREVDSASVMVNASTRLSDGGVYGLGAEIGISTDKIHARGPMGVQELTTTKFVVLGEGHLRE